MKRKPSQRPKPKSTFLTKVNAAIFILTFGHAVWLYFWMKDPMIKLGISLLISAMVVLTTTILYLLTKIKEDVHSIATDKFASDEAEISDIRKKLYFYWVTLYEGKLLWRHTCYDFGKLKIAGKLIADGVEVSPDPKVGSIEYSMEALVKGNRLVLIKYPATGTEMPVVGVFPDFTLDFSSKHFGTYFLLTYDAVDMRNPVIVSAKPLIDEKKIGEVGTESSHKLWNMWTKSHVKSAVWNGKEGYY